MAAYFGHIGRLIRLRNAHLTTEWALIEYVEPVRTGSDSDWAPPLTTIRGQVFCRLAVVGVIASTLLRLKSEMNQVAIAPGSDPAQRLISLSHTRFPLSQLVVGKLWFTLAAMERENLTKTLLNEEHRELGGKIVSTIFAAGTNRAQTGRRLTFLTTIYQKSEPDIRFAFSSLTKKTPCLDRGSS